jgi:hypothetical protein
VFDDQRVGLVHAQVNQDYLENSIGSVEGLVDHL